MTLALVDAELRGAAALARALGVGVPDEWPPELFEPNDLERMRKLLTEPANAGWAIYYLIQRDPRHLVGIAGFAGAASREGAVEVGYSILRPHRRRGYASEALAALVVFAFGHAGVERVTALTLPELGASIGVLERGGFALVGADPHSTTLRYELTRSDFVARAACDPAISSRP